MRKRYDAKFKVRVVLEALREQNTAAQIEAKYEIHLKADHPEEEGQRDRSPEETRIETLPTDRPGLLRTIAGRWNRKTENFPCADSQSFWD